MKTQIALISLLALAGITLFMQGGNNLSMEEGKVFMAYTQWKYENNKNTNGSEDLYRFSVFSKNFEFAEQNNAAGTSGVTLKMTKFADLTLEEYKEIALTKIVKDMNMQYTETAQVNVTADAVNWVAKGAVTPIKDQGQCGSCWAFSASAGLEGLHEIKTGTLTSFSEQQITSCTPAPFSFGCNGGNSMFAYIYTSNNGIETEASYPYEQKSNPKTQPCNYNKSDVVWQNKGVGQVPANNVAAMKSQLNVQPLSVAIDAGNIYFQLYSGGVLSNENCGSQLDHAVTLVAMDAGSSTPYWTIKNSWGTGWGNSGYANFAIVEGNGICGINMDVVYPTA